MVVVMLVLAAMLLASLRDMQREVERVLVATDVQSLRTELQLAVASAINRGQEAELQGWPNRNPLEIAGRTQTAVPGDGAGSGGRWVWVAEMRVLRYEYADGSGLSLRVVRAGPEIREAWGLGGGLLLVSEPSSARQR